MSAPPDLSVCMIVKNEASNLLEGLPNYQGFADEIIVVDTGSTDSSREIALRFTPHVHDFQWIEDFSAARNFSLAKAHGRYALWLDADDRFSPEMQERIRTLKGSFDGRKGFYFLLENQHKDEESTYCYQLRCVPVKDEIRFQGRIHEQLFPNALQYGLEFMRTDIVVTHLGYMDHALCMAKTRRNLSLLEKEREEGRDDLGLHFFLAHTYGALEMDHKAIQAMKTAMERMQQPNMDEHILVEGFLFLSGLQERAGEKGEALRSLVKATALIDNCTQHFYNAGAIFQKLGRHDQAAYWLKKTMGRDHTPNLYPSRGLPPSRELHLKIAYSLFCLKKNESAGEHMKEAWKKGAPVTESWERIGLGALMSSRNELALMAYENADRAGPMSVDGYCNLGTLYKNQGYAQKARERYRRALELDPHHKDTLANLGHLCMAFGDWRGARDCFSHLREQGHTDLDILLGLQWLAARERDWKHFRNLQNEILSHPLMEPMGRSCDGTPDPKEALIWVAERLDEQRKPKLSELARNILQVL